MIYDEREWSRAPSHYRPNPTSDLEFMAFCYYNIIFTGYALFLLCFIAFMASGSVVWASLAIGLVAPTIYCCRKLVETLDVSELPPYSDDPF